MSLRDTKTGNIHQYSVSETVQITHQKEANKEILCIT